MNYRLACLIILGPLVAVFSALPTPSAEARARQSIIDAFNIVSPGPLERSQRLRLADLVQAFCSDMMRQVPGLSPRESDWLDNEINEGRIEGLLGTVDLSQRVVRLNMQSCVSNAEAVKATTDITSESLAWLLIARSIYFNYATEHLDILKKNFSSLGDEYVQSSRLFSMMSDAIINNVVVHGLVLVTQGRAQ